MASLVTDEMLEAFCMAGTYDRIAALVGETVGGLVDTLTVNVPVEESHDEALASWCETFSRSQAIKTRRSTP